MKVKTKKMVKDAKMPSYAHQGDAGMDLFAAEETVIKPMERKLVSTGLQIAVPRGFEAQVRPKSGLAIDHGLTVLNTPGTIDSCYRGEIKVILLNLSNKEYKVEKGSKIAQMVFNKIEEAELEEAKELEETARNQGGFGSTGKR